MTMGLFASKEEKQQKKEEQLQKELELKKKLDAIKVSVGNSHKSHKRIFLEYFSEYESFAGGKIKPFLRVAMRKL